MTQVTQGTPARSDAELADAVREHGGVTAAARALGIPKSTLQGRLAKIATPALPTAPGPEPRLTRAMVNEALLPPNNCKVRQFLDTTSPEQRKLIEEVLAYDRKDLSAAGVRDLLIRAGYPEATLPGVDAINDHRAGKRPCRCKG